MIYSVQVIDPYEEPNPDKWPTQQVRLQLIEDCRQNSLGPFFVVMCTYLSFPTQYKSEINSYKFVHAHSHGMLQKSFKELANCYECLKNLQTFCKLCYQLPMYRLI